MSPARNKIDLAIVILAAGEGTRFKSARPKVLHEICGKPLLYYILKTSAALSPVRTVVVVGHRAEDVRSAVGDGAEYVVQEEQLGTAHAVGVARDALAGFRGMLLVLSGDTPLLRPETLSALIDEYTRTGAAATLLSAELDDPSGYGRLVMRDGGIAGIIEERDATPKERRLKVVNTGIYCFDPEKLFAALAQVGTKNDQHEYYLTDVVGILAAGGETISAHRAQDPSEVLGVNSRRQLAEADAVMRGRINDFWMAEGVTLVLPDSTFISPEVKIGRDTIIHPFSFLSGRTEVGRDCTLGPSVRIIDSAIGDGVAAQYAVIEGSTIDEGASLGPFCRLRPGTVVGRRARVGSFVELKKTRLGEASKVPHLSYIGDAAIGKDVNVGAGTITCNYDGFEKHATEIKDGAFLGSDTMLIAPVTIGAGAVTGAGSAISSDVPDDSLAVERSEQKIVEGWAKKRRERKAHERKARERKAHERKERERPKIKGPGESAQE